MIFYKECVQTYTLYGCDVGYAMNTELLTNQSFDFCERHPYKSCGVTLKCDVCEVYLCEFYIEDDESGDVCKVLIEKMNELKRYK